MVSLALQIIEKLSVGSPTRNSKLNLMKEISGEFDLQWDSSIEAELCKPTEDSLVSADQRCQSHHFFQSSALFFMPARIALEF